jgi:hypothetical protein
MASARKERIARNESAFRQLNERLESSVHRGRTEPAYAGFVCECGDGDCDMTVRVPLDAYEAVRQNAMDFIVVPGHELADTEDVIDEGDGYLVVRKHADVAEIVDERSERR